MKNFTLPQVLVIVAAIFLIGTVTPSLLDAKSDISILIGVMIVVSIFYAVVSHGKKILKALGLDESKESE